MLTVNDWSDAVVYLLVVAARLLLPLAIPRYPLPGITVALVLDAVDQSIFQAFSTIDLEGYQTYDKALDVYYLTITYASTIRNWDAGPVFAVGRFLWYYRLVGVTLFEYADARWMLLVFPNTFEYYVIAIEAVKVSRDPFRLGRQGAIVLAAVIWVVIKLPQEWWLHVAELDLTDVIKEHLLLSGPDETWWDAIAGRPAVVGLLVGGVVLVVAGLVRAERALPEREWEATLSADEQGRHLGWAVPADRFTPTATWGWPFVEKAVLVTLVTLIFGQILPGADGHVVRVAVATTLIIAVSTVVSQRLLRWEVTWQSTVTEFVVMGAANTAIGFGVQLLLPGDPPAPPLRTSLFLIALLTLIVVLFDRFKQISRHPSRRRGRLRAAARALAERASTTTVGHQVSSGRR